MKPAARISDMHICPMVTPGTPPVPHVGGPVIMGEPTVLIGMLPAARATDMAVCVGPPDSIAMGSPTVLIGMLPAARMGDPTIHGGTIVLGCPTVLIGESGSGGGAGGAGIAGIPKAEGLLDSLSEFARDIYHSLFGETYAEGIVVKGDKEFREKTKASLDRIAKTKSGKKMLDEISTSGKTVTIVESEKGNTEVADNFNDGLQKKNGKPGPGTDSTVKFNPDRKQIGDGSEPWMNRSPDVGLAHEMIHASHDANGTTEFDHSNPRKSPQNYELQTVGLKGTKDGKNVDYSGNDYTENKIRSELGEPQRPRY